MPAPTRDEAWELFCEWTASESLRRHVLGVEAAMRAYAAKYGEDEELWAATGILHDLDYERHPDLETGHPRIAIELFEEREYPPELIDAVAGHAPYLGVPRESKMSRTLFAVDELTGFLAAVALVRPEGIVDRGQPVGGVARSVPSLTITAPTALPPSSEAEPDCLAFSPTGTIETSGASGRASCSIR